MDLYETIPLVRIPDVCKHFATAFQTRDIAQFMTLVFPPEWRAVTARILETGVSMASEPCAWAPRWTEVSPTVRLGRDALATHVKSCIYRAHDCLHQLWGLPIPSAEFSDDECALYKRAQMCGEVTVLTLTEFVLCDSLRRRFPPLSGLLESRNALQMLDGPLCGRSTEQIAARLDTLLHKKLRPAWVRNHVPSMAFCDDYVPMLETDRRMVDHNWALMKRTGWRPIGAPNSRFSRTLDGLELTLWMVRDFFHLAETDEVVDVDLQTFNQKRRTTLPPGWDKLA